MNNENELLKKVNEEKDNEKDNEVETEVESEVESEVEEEVNPATEEEVKEEVMEENEEGATPSPKATTETEEEVSEEVSDVEDGSVEDPMVEAEKMLPQSKVNELIGQARREGREAALREYRSQMFGKYGVSDENELNDIFGKGQAYESLNDDYTTQSNSLRDVMAENALLKSKVRDDKYEDVKLILGGKGLDVTIENIESLLPTHPEWLSSYNGGNSLNDGVGLVGGGVVPEGINPVENKKPTTLGKLGSELSIENNSEDLEKEQARKLLGY